MSEVTFTSKYKCGYGHVCDSVTTIYIPSYPELEGEFCTVCYFIWMHETKGLVPAEKIEEDITSKTELNGGADKCE